MRIACVLASISLAVTVSACASPGSQYCQAAAECDEEIPFLNIPVDGVGSRDDSVEVCARQVDGYLTSLRQNEEAVCAELADAYQAWFDCIDEEEARCEAWYDSECDNEREDIQDLQNDADNRCNE